MPFRLLRIACPSSEHLQTNYTVDIQRNRVQTANILRLALRAPNYSKSMELRFYQINKIQASISAADPFCQNLIKDLQQSYDSHNEYRSTHYNIIMQHSSERGTYTSDSTSSTLDYQSHVQHLLATYFKNQYN